LTNTIGIWPLQKVPWKVEIEVFLYLFSKNPRNLNCSTMSHFQQLCLTQFFFFSSFILKCIATNEIVKSKLGGTMSRRYSIIWLPVASQ
jgi:hypothetical protein